MSVQTSYGITPAVAYKGMLAEQFSQRQVDSFIAEDLIVGGMAVERGTDPTNQVLRLTTAADIYGVAISAISDTETAEGGDLEYVVEAMVPVLYRGRIWVLAGGNVTVGAAVVPETGADAGNWVVGAGLLGKNRAVARSAAADGELLLIELLGPQGPVA